jgi:YVTN family beta-propeller protein
MIRLEAFAFLIATSLWAAACAGDARPGANGGTSTPIPAVNGAAVYVVNGQDHSISVIDPATNTVVGTILLSGVTWPHHVYLSKDGSRMLVAVPNMDLSGGHGTDMEDHPGAVLLLDSSTGATLASRSLEMMNHNAIFSPDGTEIWTSQMMMPGSVLVLDAQTLATRQSIPVGDMPAEVTFSKDGTMGFVANGMTDSVSVISVATKKVMATIPVGKDPVGPWPGVDGIMYTDCEQGKSISAISPASMSVVRTYNLGFTPGMVGTPPGTSGELWVTDEDDGKVVFNTTTQDQKTGELVVGAGAHGMAFSADGKTAYITNQAGGTVSIVDVASHTLVKSLPVGAKPNGIAYRQR